MDQIYRVIVLTLCFGVLLTAQGLAFMKLWNDRKNEYIKFFSENSASENKIKEFQEVIISLELELTESQNIISKQNSIIRVLREEPRKIEANKDESEQS